MIEALKTVVHYSSCVQFNEGLELSKKYYSGSTYPVFILTNERGEVIRRWTGFGGAQKFVNQLKSALIDLTSIDERLARFKKQPSFRDAVTLALYYSDTRQNLKAIKFYEQAQQLSPGKNTDYSYQIFTNTANAVWNSSLSFDSLLAAADNVMKNRKNIPNITRTISILGRAARKAKRTNSLGKYLRIGLEVTAGSREQKYRQLHQEFVIDTILYVRGDTLAAIKAKEFSMEPNWKNDPKQFYRYSAWCLERKLNLAKAEMYARTSVDWAEPGQHKAMALHQLASILDIRSKYKEAVRFMNMAVEEVPSHVYYENELERMRQNLNNEE